VIDPTQSRWPLLLATSTPSTERYRCGQCASQQKSPRWSNRSLWST